jgi:hypothetical protein
MESNISTAMKDAVGTQISRRVSYPVSASDIRRWALAVYWPEPAPARYLTANEAAVVAPEEFNPFGWIAAESEVHPAAATVNQLDPDRTEKQIGVDGPGLKYQLNGGISVEYGVVIRPGDVITSTNRLAGYTEREGRLGKMLMTTTEDTWTNQRGDTVKSSAMTLIRY